MIYTGIKDIVHFPGGILPSIGDPTGIFCISTRIKTSVFIDQIPSHFITRFAFDMIEVETVVKFLDSR